MTTPDDDADDRFADVLAAYDDSLAGLGPKRTVGLETDATLGKRVEEAVACLELLEAAWPRQPVVSASQSNTIGRFQVLRELGRGGFGVVFLADDPHLNRRVAIKIPHPGVLVSSELRDRLSREAEAVARLSHPNLVPIHEFGESGPVCYLVTEYVPGPSLALWLREHSAALAPREVAAFLATLAEAVAYIHGQGVLHRDIKPSNILLQSPVASLSDGVPRLVDFGLAKLAEDSLGSTRSGAMLGTPAYMAPEQADNRLAPASPAIDIYALGVVLYEMLVRRPPFRGENDADTIRRLLSEEPLPPRRVRSEIPSDLEAICLRCLEKSPRQRYGSTEELVRDLHSFLAGKPTRARHIGVVGRTTKWVRRRPVLAGLGLLIGASLLVHAAWISWYAFQVQEHNASLQAALDRAEAGERRLRLQNYAAQIKLGSTMAKDDPSGSLTSVLNSLRPKPDEDDLRGFEWHHLWHLASSEQKLRGHFSDVYAVAISPDGRLCVSGGANGDLHLWEMSTGASLGKWSGHAVPVKHIAFNADGRRMISCATDHSEGELKLWDVAERKLLAQLPKNGPRFIWRTAFLPESELIGFCGFENDDIGIVGLWNPATGTTEYPLREPRSRILEFAISPDRSLLATASAAGEVRLTGLSDRTLRRSVSAHRGTMSGIEFLNDGRSLVSAGFDGKLAIWNVDSLKGIRVLDLKERITSLRIAPDGKRMAVCTRAEQPTSHDTMRLWSLPDFQRMKAELRPTHAINDIAYGPDGRTIAAACGDHHVTLWRPFQVPVSTLKPTGRKEAWSVAFSPDNKTLAVGYDDEAGFNRETLKTWDLRTGKEIANLPHGSMVTGVVHLPDGNTLASAGYDRQIKIWDARTWKLQTSLKGPSKRIRSLAASPEGRFLASSGWEKTTRIWDVAKGVECAQLENESFVNRIAYSPDGMTLAVADYEGRLIIWDPASGRRVREFHDSASIFGVAYSPDGRLIATTNRDGELRLHDLESEVDPRSLLGHRGVVGAVVFTPDGKTVATGGEDRVVRLWSVATGRELLVLGDLPNKVNSLAFSADGHHLAAALHDGSVRIWHAGTP